MLFILHDIGRYIIFSNISIRSTKYKFTKIYNKKIHLIKNKTMFVLHLNVILRCNTKYHLRRTIN